MILAFVLTITTNVEYVITKTLFFLAPQSTSGLSRLILEVSGSHTIRHTHTHPVGLLWTSDRLVAETATFTTNTADEYPCPQRDSNAQSQQSRDRGFERTATDMGK